jgi:hypothetical protein
VLFERDSLCACARANYRIQCGQRRAGAPSALFSRRPGSTPPTGVAHARHSSVPSVAGSRTELCASSNGREVGSGEFYILSNHGASLKLLVVRPLDGPTPSGSARLGARRVAAEFIGSLLSRLLMTVHSCRDDDLVVQPNSGKALIALDLDVNVAGLMPRQDRVAPVVEDEVALKSNLDGLSG